MKLFALILCIIVLAGCASFRARMWAKASDIADEMDGSDDVPSVVFEKVKKD